MNCPKCGGALYLDRESAVELAHYGMTGGRYRCTAGCTDRWIKERVIAPVVSLEPDPRGRYTRAAHTAICQHCRRPFQTRGNNTKYDPACKAERSRAYWHTQYKIRRRRRAA